MPVVEKGRRTAGGGRWVGGQDEERVWKTGRERHLQGCGCRTKAGGRKAAAKLDTNLSGGTMAEICGWVDGHLKLVRAT